MDTRRGLEATPLAIDGVLYVTGSWSVVHSLDAKTGAERWRWDPQVDRSYGRYACCDVVNRGVAVVEDELYVGTLDGRLVALDARSGQVRWEVQTTDPSLPYTITGAPRIVADQVVIGNGGADLGVRGYVSAYDRRTGNLTWRFFTVPGDPRKPFESEAMARAAKTWTGEWWQYGGGGTVWDSFAYDEANDLLYVGTGNGSPWNREIRSPDGGDNLYLASIIALNASSGEYVWHYQTTPGETWDYTATQHMILADLVIGGEERAVVMQAPKNGFFYVLDRLSGELLSALPFSATTWATHVDLDTGRPVETPGARFEIEPLFVRPGAQGAHNWQPMSYSQTTKLVYLPVQDIWSPYGQPSAFAFRPGQFNTGVVPAAGQKPEPDAGYLVAWDPAVGVERWRVRHTSAWNGGVMSTDGGLVFQGTGDGLFAAYDAADGALLWQVNLGIPVLAPPITYELDDVQYVALLAGGGGGYGLSGGRQPEGRLFVFSLHGTGTPPNTPLPPPTLQFGSSTEAGALLYAEWCSGCHGLGNHGESALGSPDSSELASIVLGGSKSADGMPSFARWLSRRDVEALAAYLGDR